MIHNDLNSAANCTDRAHYTKKSHNKQQLVKIFEANILLTDKILFLY